MKRVRSSDDIKLFQAVSLARSMSGVAGVVHAARTAAIRFDVPYDRCIGYVQRAIEACNAARMVKPDEPTA